MSRRRLTEVLFQHRQVPVGIRDLVRCTCDPDASYTPDRAWADHLTTVVLDLLNSDETRQALQVAIAERDAAREALERVESVAADLSSHRSDLHRGTAARIRAAAAIRTQLTTPTKEEA